ILTTCVMRKPSLTPATILLSSPASAGGGRSVPSHKDLVQVRREHVQRQLAGLKTVTDLDHLVPRFPGELSHASILVLPLVLRGRAWFPRSPGAAPPGRAGRSGSATRTPWPACAPSSNAPPRRPCRCTG